MDELWRLVEVARGSDRAAFPRAAEAVWRRAHYSFIFLTEDTGEVIAAMDALCDSVLPLSSMDPADLLDAPWPTPARAEAILSHVDSPYTKPGYVRLDDLAERAIDMGDERLKRLVLTSRLGQLERPTATRVLESLESVDVDFLEAVFARDADLPCPPSMRDEYDELIWRLTDHPDPVKWEYCPRTTPPRGLRFVRRGLDLLGGRLPAAPGEFEGDRYLQDVIAFLRGAELTEWESTPIPQSHLEPTPKRGRSYRGSELIGSPAVAAALARAPEVFPMIVDDPADTLTHEDVCDFLHLGTGDGVTWDFGFNDEIKSIVDTGPDILSDDVLEARLAAHPDVVEADHADREWFMLTFAREMGADEVLAICIDALTDAHLELARHLAA